MDADDVIELLADLGRTIARESDPRVALQAVVDAAVAATGARIGAFVQVGEAAAGVPAFVVSGVAREGFSRLPLPRATQLFAPIFHARQPVRVANLARDPRHARNPPHAGAPAGHPPMASFLGVPVLAREGQVLGALLFGHPDIDAFSERAERRALGLAGHAATALDQAALTGARDRLLAELDKANTEIDQLAFAAAHDLRAPLRGIANLATWIEEDLGDGGPASVREHLELLKGRAARLDRLIHGLLDLIRVGRSRQRPERLDVSELLHETIDLLNPPAASRILIIGAMPTVVAERAALQQVCHHLIANAVHHAGRADVVVRITATERPGEVELAIADNGAGIAREHQDRVWDMFHTLRARDLAESTGVGLTIVRKQVEAAGGRAWFEPQPDEGTTVRFTWPRRTK